MGSVKSNNERLEYLGDSVISTAVAHYLFKRYPHEDEGFLTEMRSKMVSRATLNKVAVKMGLHEMLHIDARAGGYKSVDGNALEALMGAVFLDKGYRFAEKIIQKRIIGVHIDMDEMEKRDWNYKSKLIDWCQKERLRVNFQVQSTMRQQGKKFYKVAAVVGNEVWGEGLDQSIKAAEQQAAENAYKSRVQEIENQHRKENYREVIEEKRPADVVAEPVAGYSAPVSEVEPLAAEPMMEYGAAPVVEPVAFTPVVAEPEPISAEPAPVADVPVEAAFNTISARLQSLTDNQEIG